MTADPCDRSGSPTHNQAVVADQPNDLSTQLAELDERWFVACGVARCENDQLITLQKPTDLTPGSETGLTSKTAYRNVLLSFCLKLDMEALFLAKICLQEPHNQASNSYHLYCDTWTCYFARHHHVLGRLSLQTGKWMNVKLAFYEGQSFVRIDGKLVCTFRDDTLPNGHCFLGLKGGTVQLRHIEVREFNQTDIGGELSQLPPHSVLYEGSSRGPAMVSVITTVYDRVRSLACCLHSMNQLRYPQWEQLIVADAPEKRVLDELTQVVCSQDRVPGKRIFATLHDRANDWGITPAAIGLQIALGKYVCFLSDDNCYLPDHFDALVSVLDNSPDVGFAYCSCLYAGQWTLNCSTPHLGGIDLGQPLFRRKLFDQFLNGSLPFREFAWDWRMIEHFMKNGVSWRHLDKATFIFRSERYPHLVEEG